jgi:hypothetical protein
LFVFNVVKKFRKKRSDKDSNHVFNDCILSL